MKITHLANAGAMISGSSKIVIDGLSCDGDLYPGTKEKDKNRIISGIYPYDKINLMVFTHEHPDHFDDKGFIEFINSNKDAYVIMNEMTSDRLPAEVLDTFGERLIVPRLEPLESTVYEIDGTVVHVSALAHDGGSIFSNVNNLAVLIEMDGKRILHLGDAAMSESNHRALPLGAAPIDLLIAAFPNVGIPSSRQKVKEYIDPVQVMAVHFPLPEADQYGWTKSAKESFRKSNNGLKEVLFADEAGEEIII